MALCVDFYQAILKMSCLNHEVLLVYSLLFHDVSNDLDWGGAPY